MAAMKTELWGRGSSFRSLTVAKGSSASLASVRLASGRSNLPIEDMVRRWGLDETVLVLSSIGRERWYWDTKLEDARSLVKRSRERYSKKGLINYGVSSIASLR